MSLILQNNYISISLLDVCYFSFSMHYLFFQLFLNSCVQYTTIICAPGSKQDQEDRRECVIVVSCDICDTWETSCRRSHDTFATEIARAHALSWTCQCPAGDEFDFYTLSLLNLLGHRSLLRKRGKTRPGNGVQLGSSYYCEWQHSIDHIYGKEDTRSRFVPYTV
jgi:hypothetical protein